MKCMIMLLFVATASWQSMAEFETIDDIRWGYRVQNGEAIIYDAIPSSSTDTVSVPSEIKGYPVTMIENSFLSENDVAESTSVMIPESVKNIGYQAFYNCGRALTNVTIPHSVTNIGRWAFAACFKLTNIVIPDSVRSLCAGAFCYCTGLTSIIIPSDVTSIEGGVFEGCSGLTNVMISEGVTSIGDSMFRRCTGLESITIPSSVTNIDFGAFYMCSGLKSIIIPASVISIGNEAFDDCTGLTSVTISDGVKTIGEGAFSTCTGLTSIAIPSSVTSISHSSFYGCSGLTSVTIPESVTDIGKSAFAGCNKLANITISSNVVSIGSGAFSQCTALMEIDFEGLPPNGLSSAAINQNASICYPSKYQEQWLPVIAECGFSNATADIHKKSDGGPYTEVVDDIEWIFSVTDHEAILGTGTTAQTACHNDVSGVVSIPSMLGEWPVVKISANAFYNCRELTSVTIPVSVASIGQSAFSECAKLASVNIPVNVKEICNKTFYNCGALADVYFEGETMSAIGVDAFKGCNWDLIMHVPADWQGRGRTLCGYSVWRARSSDEEKSVILTTTNVVVQYVLNSVQPEIAVPVSGDTGFVAVITEVTSSGAVSVPIEWKANYPQYEAKFGTDFGKSLMAKSGKRDCANNEMLVWQDYVAGTDPTNPDSKFSASITMVEGVPVISYSPELTAEQAALRTYKTWGKKQLGDTEWTNLTDASGETLKTYNFFKVTVEMK